MGTVPHSYNRYTAGNKVYGQTGRPNATSGTVDPAGYVDRERRSGLAAAALRGPTAAGQHPPAAFLGETVARTPPHVLARMLLAQRAAGRAGPKTGGRR